MGLPHCSRSLAEYFGGVPGGVHELPVTQCLHAPVSWHMVTREQLAGWLAGRRLRAAVQRMVLPPRGKE